MSTSAPAAAKPGWLARLTGRAGRDRDRLTPLYSAIVARARDPFWYRDGQVPDSVTGRFDMLAAVTALVLVRMERLPGEAAKRDSVLLTETFIADMDESLLELGVGDYSVGKHVGRLVGALGGRLAAFREAADGGDFVGPVRRNVFHEAPPSEAALDLVAERLARFWTKLQEESAESLLVGRLPAP